MLSKSSLCSSSSVLPSTFPFLWPFSFVAILTWSLSSFLMISSPRHGRSQYYVVESVLQYPFFSFNENNNDNKKRAQTNIHQIDRIKIPASNPYAWIYTNAVPSHKRTHRITSAYIDKSANVHKQKQFVHTFSFFFVFSFFIFHSTSREKVFNFFSSLGPELLYSLHLSFSKNTGGFIKTSLSSNVDKPLVTLQIYTFLSC